MVWKKEAWRAVKDVMPSAVSHNYKGQGVFGEGTYFTLEETKSSAYAYGGFGGSGDAMEQWSLVFSYEIEPKNALFITPADVSGLDGADLLTVMPRGAKKLLLNRGEDLSAQKLGELTLARGYDCLLLTSDWQDLDRQQKSPVVEVDGGDQVLIPTGSSLEASPISFEVIINSEVVDEDELELSAKKFGLKLVQNEDGYLGIHSLSIAKQSDVEAFLGELFKRS